MKPTTKIILVAAIVLIFGVSLACVGMLFDPFSLPFQDYEQMPAAYQQAYETRSAAMQVIRLIGSGVAVLAALTIPVAWLAGRSAQGKAPK